MRLASRKGFEAKGGCRWRSASWRVLAVACTLLGALMIGGSFRRGAVPKAEAAQRRATARLELTKRVAVRASSLAERIHPRLGQIVRSATQPLIKVFEREHVKAVVDVSISKVRVTTDYCLKTFHDIAPAQKAAAALHFAGITWRIRPVGETNASGDCSAYDLLVPQSNAPLARLALQNVSIVPLRSFSHPLDAMKTLERLKKQQIPATIRPLRRDHVVFVKTVDEAAARQLVPVP